MIEKILLNGIIFFVITQMIINIIFLWKIWKIANKLQKFEGGRKNETLYPLK